MLVLHHCLPQKVITCLWHYGKMKRGTSVWKVSHGQAHGHTLPKAGRGFSSKPSLSSQFTALTDELPQEDLAILISQTSKQLFNACSMMYKHLCWGLQAVTVWPQPISPTSYHITSLRVPLGCFNPLNISSVFEFGMHSLLFSNPTSVV